MKATPSVLDQINRAKELLAHPGPIPSHTRHRYYHVVALPLQSRVFFQQLVDEPGQIAFLFVALFVYVLTGSPNNVQHALTMGGPEVPSVLRCWCSVTP